MAQAVARVDEDTPTGAATHSVRPLVVVLVAAAAWYGAFIWRMSWVVDGRRRFTLFDDAMISMTYARTLAEGQGLVWYPGAPRVEGFTNPLWVGLMAALHALGLDGSTISLAVSVLGAVLCLASALLAVRILRRLTTTSPGLEAAVAGLVAFSYPLVYWSLRGMEVGLVTALTLVAVLLALAGDDGAEGRSRRNDAALSVVLVAGVSTRLDFAVVAAVVLAWRAWRAGSGRRLAPLVVPGTAVAVALVAQELARHAYYGRWVPNTYTLKTAGVPLVDRLTRGGWVTASVVVGSLAASVVLVVAARRRGVLTRPGPTALPVLVAGALLAYSWWAGGDAWEWMAHANRYLAPAVVLVGVVGAASAADLLRAPRTGARPDSVVRAVTLAGVVAVIGPWCAFAVLAVGGLHPTARVALGAAEILLLMAAVSLVGVIAARRIATATRVEAPLRAAALVVVVLTIGAGLLPTLQWMGDGGAYRTLDQPATELGLALHEVTRPDATVAVVAAGAPIYYSERAGVDLLGKSDAHIAARPSREPFLPGHTKWDYRYSIGELRPDVIAELFHLTAADLELLADEGYQLMVIDQDLSERLQLVYVRSDSALVDRSRLVPADPALAERFEAAIVGDH